MDGNTLELVQDLFGQLRRRRFPLGPMDLGALRDALAAGFGWSSRDDLCDLLVALWAKSTHEAEVIRALFARLPWPEAWTVEEAERPLPAPEGAVSEPIVRLSEATGPEETGAGAPTSAPVVRRVGALPPLMLADVDVADARLVFVEQYPLSRREIAQSFRRLRRPQRFGPATELDVPTSVTRRARAGVSVPPALVAPRRNTSRLLMF